jgi:hypothetical protein
MIKMTFYKIIIIIFIGHSMINTILHCEEAPANVQTSIQVLHDHFFELLKLHVRQPDFILI